MRRIGEKGGLIALDEMSQPGKSERGRNEEERDDPDKPDR